MKHNVSTFLTLSLLSAAALLSACERRPADPQAPGTTPGSSTTPTTPPAGVGTGSGTGGGSSDSSATSPMPPASAASR
jgi:hypothetical protein